MNWMSSHHLSPKLPRVSYNLTRNTYNIRYIMVLYGKLYTNIDDIKNTRCELTQFASSNLTCQNLALARFTAWTWPWPSSVSTLYQILSVKVSLRTHWVHGVNLALARFANRTLIYSRTFINNKQVYCDQRFRLILWPFPKPPGINSPP